MTRIIDRYASAINAGNLKSEPDTLASDSDVLGAFGLASKKHKLAAALARMFCGGDREAKVVAALMTRMLVGKAYRDGDAIGEAAADLIAGLVLQWHRDHACTSCGGHGFLVRGGVLGEGRSVIGDERCRACRGSGKRPFDPMFPTERLNLAHWLRAQVERETELAGPNAMAKLADRLRL